MKTLSLIIATYNRADWVVQTLKSVVLQKCPTQRWDCTVVDNNSSDDTRLKVEQFIAAHSAFDIKYIFEVKQGLSHARNAGIEASRGRYIAIIDDDELINDDFVQGYIDLFESHPEAGTAGGVILAQYRNRRPAWMSHLPERAIANPMHFGESEREFPSGRIPGGGNMAIRREVLERHGSFNTELGRSGASLAGGEESELFERLAAAGVKCWYTPRAVMYHLIPDEKLTLEYFKRLCYNMGLSQRYRAQKAGRGVVLGEATKWCATIALALIMLLRFRASAARYLFIMRWNISRGLFA